jgi:hypothetical protein
VSNVSVQFMTKLLADDRKPGIDKDGKVVPKIVPAANQIELHPYVRSQSYSSVWRLRPFIGLAFSKMSWTIAIVTA